LRSSSSSVAEMYASLMLFSKALSNVFESVLANSAASRLPGSPAPDVGTGTFHSSAPAAAAAAAGAAAAAEEAEAGRGEAACCSDAENLERGGVC